MIFAFEILDDGVVHWSMYSKPINQYLYLPRGSCHDSTTFGSLIYAEAMRCIRRNRLWSDALESICKLEKRLVARGYSEREVRLQCSRAIKHAQLRRSGNFAKEVCAKRRKLFFKCVASSSFNKRSLRRCFDKHKHLLPGSVTFATSVQHNIFRLLYHSSWTRNQSLAQAPRVGG